MNLLPVVVLLQITLAVSFSAFGQNEGTAKAEMINSFEVATNGDLRSFLDQYFAALVSRPKVKGWVYTNGPAAYVSTRNRLISNHIGFRKFDPAKIEFKHGRNIGKLRTDLWIVPEGVAPPEIKPESWIFKDVGRATKNAVVRAFADTLTEANRVDNHQIYIISYGTPTQVAQRERWIRNAIVFRRFDSYRITFVNGGPGSVRTVIWLVPPGAENPTP